MPQIARLGDRCSGHGCFPSRPNDQASVNVVCNNKGIHRKTDHWQTHCFIGSTEIVVDGVSTSFQSLENQWRGSTIISYWNNERILCNIINFHKTYSLNLVEITLEDRSVITCTPDHLFLLTDGTYKEARHLSDLDELQS